MRILMFWLVPFTLLMAATSATKPAQAQDTQSCGSYSGLWSCNRDIRGDIVPGNHNYLWDARDGSACGMGEVASIGRGGSGDVIESGPSVDSCNFVPSSEGQEDNIMDTCRDNANNWVWFPGINDCHNAVQDSVESSGLINPEVPGGRLDTRNYEQSDSPQWGGNIEYYENTSPNSPLSGHSYWEDSDNYGYGYDSNGDGSLDQSIDPTYPRGKMPAPYGSYLEPSSESYWELPEDYDYENSSDGRNLEQSVVPEEPIAEDSKPEDSGSSNWPESNDYGYDSDGDGILDQSFDPSNTSRF